ncbi:MAG: hypothetical protein ACXAC6_14665 [Candidatus Hodarchaeales archaeon]
MKPDEALLLRTRLHIRGGKRRLNQGKVSDGITALHDAIIHGMQWFLFTNHPELLYPNVEADYDLTDDTTLFQFLQRTESFAHFSYHEDFQYLSDILDQALDNRISGFDKGRYIKIINKFMNQLGVEPFSFDELPPEDPSTF